MDVCACVCLYEVFGGRGVPLRLCVERSHCVLTVLHPTPTFRYDHWYHFGFVPSTIQGHAPSADEVVDILDLDSTSKRIHNTPRRGQCDNSYSPHPLHFLLTL